MSPLSTQKGRHIASLLTAYAVCVSVCECAGGQTRHVHPMLGNISPVLGYSVVFGARLNVGQRHRRRANINSALVQSIVPVVAYSQH